MKRPVTHGDRLWPVVLVLVTLVVGALALEVVAGRHEAPPIRIAIASNAALPDDESGSVDLVVDSRAPLDALHERARTEARRGEIDAALATFEALVAIHPDSALIRDDYGYWLLIAGRAREALAQLEQARALAPDDAVVLSNMGAVLVRLGRRAEAEQAFQAALARNRGATRARVGLSALQLARGDVTEALATIEPALGAGSNAERARAEVQAGEVLLAAGRRQDAEAAFVRAVERAPADPSVRLFIAEAWRDHGGDVGADRAVAVLERAATMAPDVARVHSALGRARERVGDDGGATDAYRRALSLEPAYVYVRRRLLRLAMDRGDFEEARGHADRLLREDGEDPEHHFLAALVASREGRSDAAREAYRRAIELENGDYPEAWFNLGILERSEGRLPEAIAAYESAIAHRPDYLAAYNNLGLALMAAGRTDEAESRFREAIARDEHYAAARVNLGELLASRGEVGEALESVERALAERGGDHPATELTLGRILEAATRHDDARRVYRHVGERHPRQIEAFIALGRLELGLGDLRAAEVPLAQARAIDATNPEANRLLAELMVARGRTDDATRLYEELLDREPRDVPSRLALADLFARAGDLEGCERERSFVRAEAPEETRARARCVVVDVAQ